MARQTRCIDCVELRENGCVKADEDIKCYICPIIKANLSDFDVHEVQEDAVEIPCGDFEAVA